MITITKAEPQHAAAIAPLIVDAIGSIANRLTAQTEPTLVEQTLQTLIQQTNSRHSYEHTFVALEHNNVVGIAVLYDGKTGRTLDRQLEAFLRSEGRPVTIDVEAHDDEFYIDTICVAENVRGKGVGSQLLAFAEDEAKRRGFAKISLNVEVEKMRARQLYEHVGYRITEPWTIIDEPFHHMVKHL